MEYRTLWQRQWPHTVIWDDERGVALASTLMALVVLLVLGTAAITTTTLDLQMSGSHRSSLQAFYAAEAGIHAGMSQLSADRETSTRALPVTGLGGDDTFQYRSGQQHDAAPQPLEFVGTRAMAGYSVANGTGYNPAGYVLYVYRVTATGMGPSNAQRELTALGGYGPVAQ
jgi:Tfp pilus assembly protein PilX